jgi:hypothetical protein
MINSDIFRFPLGTRAPIAETWPVFPPEWDAEEFLPRFFQ